MKTAALFLALVLGFGATSCGDVSNDEGVAQTQSALRCAQYDVDGVTCLATKPDLLPGAHDCAANYIPAYNEIAIFTSTSFAVGGGFCQAMPNYKSYPQLGLYGWYGPYFNVKSIRVGTGSHAQLCAGQSYTGCTMFGPGSSNADVSATMWQSLKNSI